MARTTLPDIAPGFLANDAIKEFVLYSLLVFDRERVRDTLVPIIVIAPSGSGKTTLLHSMEKGLNSLEPTDPLIRIWGVDSITAASLGGVQKSGKVQKCELTLISLFDELNKWSISHLDGVHLPVFGAEHGNRMRDGKQWNTTEAKTVPIGTLLPGWRDLEGESGTASRRTHTIEQLLRRSILMCLEPTTKDREASRDYLRFCLSRVFHNVRYENTVDYRSEALKFGRLLEYAKCHPDVSLKIRDMEKIIDLTDATRARLQISPDVRYEDEFPNLVNRLAMGRALAYEREVADYDDVKYIIDVLVANARVAGLWLDDEAKSTDNLIYDGQTQKWVKKDAETPKDSKV